MSHRHLERQLHRLGLNHDSAPSLSAWRELLTWIDRSYEAVDRERYLVQHTIEVSSMEMEQLNARLEEERDKFATVFRAAAVGMAIADAKGEILDVNSTLEAILGLPRAAMVGHPAWDFIAEEDRPASRARVVDLVEGRASMSQSHMKLMGNRHEPILAEVHTTVVRDAQDRTIMLVVMVDDVTEKTRLEVDLRHAQKLESVGRLAAGIAHEINTPIQFVGDNVSFLASSFDQLLALCETYRCLCEKAQTNVLSPDDIAQQKADEETADLDYIRTNVPTSINATIDGVGRVAKIVRSMKAFAHPDHGERATADINCALRDTLTVATNELKYVAKLETQFGDIPAVPCFLSDLNQVFLNLLVNAAHAIGDVVGKSQERGLITVRTYAEEDHVVIAIGDTGTGIPKGIQDRIFDPFFTTKGVGKGTGQGLALARSVVVEQHGGSITFETAPGQGTTFFIRIPIEVPPMAAQDGQAHEPPRR